MSKGNRENLQIVLEMMLAELRAEKGGTQQALPGPEPPGLPAVPESWAVRNAGWLMTAGLVLGAGALTVIAAMLPNDEPRRGRRGPDDLFW